MTGKVAIVTGGNRGIGFEICRQLAQQAVHVVLTSRDAAKGGPHSQLRDAGCRSRTRST